jgi:hypothetical protein
MRYTNSAIGLAAAASLLLGACSGDSDDSEADRVGEVPIEMASFPAVPADAVFVVATVDCFDTDMEVEVDEDVEDAISWLWMCEIDASDPRVSGIERHAGFRSLAQSRDGLVWLVEDATITNDEGTWRGAALGADSGGPVQGEAHYVGEGAYEGLEYHYYLADLDGRDTQTRGWISSDG